MKRLVEYNSIAILHCYDCGKNFPISKETLKHYPDDIPCPECEKEKYNTEQN